MGSPALDPNDNLMDGLLGDFLDESTGLLRQLNENLLQLDDWTKGGSSAAPSKDLLNEMFRAAHSIKGLSGMLRLNDVNSLTHKVENIFDAARNGELTITAEVVDVVFRAVDRIEAMIDLLRNAGGGDAVDCRAVNQLIDGVLVRSGAAREIKTQADVEAAIAAEMAYAQKLVAEAIGPPADASDPLAGVCDDSDIPVKYLSIFIDESENTLQDLQETLLAERHAEAVETLLIGCHRLKGSAASIGLHRAARLAHFMEDLLQELRRQGVGLTVEMCDAMLTSVDVLQAFVARLKSGEQAADGFDAACRQIMRMATPEQVAAAAQGESTKKLSDEQLRAIVAQAPPESAGCMGQVVFEAGLPLVELKARIVLEKLHRIGKLFYCQPDETQLDLVTETGCLVFGLGTTITADEVSGQLEIEGVMQIETSPFTKRDDVVATLETAIPAAATGQKSDAAVVATNTSSVNAAVEPATETSTQAASAPAKSKPVETLRVDIDRLDQLMNLAGQLVINKARFGQIGDRLKGLSAIRIATQSLASAQHSAVRLVSGIQEISGSKAAVPIDALGTLARKMQEDLDTVQRELSQLTQMRGVINDLSEAVHQLGRVSDGIQTTVMDTRMVPIGPLFTRFKRVVRDLTRDSEKAISLEILGENTELDKRMIDELGDPLIHLIRNSADHGIELPEVRVAAGKNRQGTITLNAFHRGNCIVIQVSDDGRGLDSNKIRAKALTKGLITEADADKMTPHQLYQLIWQPGFSTAEKITEVSGRGMGMDIVWSKIEQLNGSIELTSEPGQGTTFTIKLPLTMAILPSLLTVIDGDVFALPVESVVEIVKVPSSDLTTVHGQSTALVRGRVISLIGLGELFDWNVAARSDGADVERDGLTVVIIGVEGHEIGLIVHDLLGEQDVVIKSMAENFQNVEGIAGASILGNGRVSLILDVGRLVEMAHKSGDKLHDALNDHNSDVAQVAAV